MLIPLLTFEMALQRDTFPFLGTYVRGDVEVKLYQNNEREHVDEYSRD